MAQLKHTDFMRGLKKLLPQHILADWQDFRFGETKWIFQVYYHQRQIHYEVSRPYSHAGRRVEIGLHFESRNRELNTYWLQQLSRHLFEIRDAMQSDIVAEQWDRGWTKIYETHAGEELTTEDQVLAAKRLALLIQTVQPIYEFLSLEEHIQ